MKLHSILSKKDTSGTCTMCPSKSYVCLIENQIKGVKKGRHRLLVSVLQVSIKRESTVNFIAVWQKFSFRFVKGDLLCL